MKIVEGQRWTSEAEPELGLGLVVRVDTRSLDVLYPAAGGLIRTYALEGAPIRRVRFVQGDVVRGHQGASFTVEAVREQDGLVTYLGRNRELPETALSDTISFSQPEDRLRGGHVDDCFVFDLRCDALDFRHRMRRSPIRGFVGGRIELIPHQLYIAAEVTSRQAPRVLLSDEVGLGKTIEACLILHRMHLNGRAQRILILVPESLVHQWFVELLRRFNLHFRIYDEERCQAGEIADPDGNPFLDEQLVLCSLNFIVQAEDRRAQALAAGWDLLVVDEAHHLGWTPETASPAYRSVEQLTGEIPGVLLLTATPEQLGLESHFARLRLLDPNRYRDLDSFRADAQQYQVVAQVADRLAGNAPISESDREALRRIFPEDRAHIGALMDQAQGGDRAAREQVLAGLLDQHGPGRVIFRNTRASMTGFPQRSARLTPLPLTPPVQGSLARVAAEVAADAGMAPRLDRYDLGDDPRVDWLAALLREDPRRKILLICRYKEKVLALADLLPHKVRASVALFHEDLTLVNRDRQAAWFAEEDGAQVLLCSEIGGEGRNFQFAHHVVLFDLPIDPELLEQRIGRLDRIGQTETIQVHVPYIAGSAQEVVARWYHEGLHSFEASLPGGHVCGEHFRNRVLELALSWHQEPDEAALEQLIRRSRRFQRDLAEQLDRGRDHLLELSSFRREPAERLVRQIRRMDADTTLEKFLTRMFDFLGIEVEETGSRTFRIRPGYLMADALPSLPRDGMIATRERRRAIIRDDVGFLSWDHPLVTDTLDLLLGARHGNSAFAVWQTVAGRIELLLEAVFVLEAPAAPPLQVDRFLPPTPIRVLVDAEGREWETPLETLRAVLTDGQDIRLWSRTELASQHLPHLVAGAWLAGRRRVTEIVDAALREMNDSLGEEHRRLLRLRERNDHVREEEILMFEAQIAALDKALSAARLRLDALRLIRKGPALGLG